jgi:hypothetical protein|tara:strand:- start:1863 stop:2321 length:459 start_codon:yes stop_codon:yes gene_type:complete
MAEDIKSGIGATIGIVLGVPATFDEAGYTALTYAEVGEAISIGAFGGTAEVLTQTPIKSGIIRKVIGSINYGSSAIQFGLFTDAGQTALNDGFDGANKGKMHSVEVSYFDGTKRYYTAIITSYEYQEISSSSFVNGASTLEVNSSIVDVVPV